MPRIIEIKGVGRRAFPDSMTDEDILKVLRDKFPSEPKPMAATAPLQPPVSTRPAQTVPFDAALPSPSMPTLQPAVSHRTRPEHPEFALAKRIGAVPHEAYMEAQARLEEEALQREPRAYGAAFARGALAGPTSALKNIPLAAERSGLRLDIPGRDKLPPQETPMYQLGERLEEKSAEMFPLPEHREMNFGEKLSNGFGQMVGFLAGGAVSKAVNIPQMLVPIIFGQTAVSLYEQSKAAGKSDEESFTNYGLGIGLDATDAIPISRTFARANKATGGKLTQVLGRMAAGGIEEATQEFVQETLQAAVEGERIYGVPEGGRGEYFKTSVEAAQIGGIIGVTMNLLGAAGGLTQVGPKRRAAARKKLAQVDAEVNKVLDQVEQKKAATPPPATPDQGEAEPKIINVKGVGERAFPDSMSDEEIKTVLRDKFKPGESVESEIGESTEGSITESIDRGRQEEFLPEKFEGMVPSLRAKIEPKGRAELLKDLSDKLQVPFRSGRFRGKAFGIYKPQQHVIRSRISHDISNIAHEVGHHIHNVLHPPEGKRQIRLDIKPLKPFTAELVPLGKPTSPPKSKPPAWLREGYANFVRMYLTEPVTAKEVAPKFYEFFESEVVKHGDLSDILMDFRTNMKMYAEMPALAKVDSMINTDTKTPASTNKWDRFYTAMVDRFKPLKDAVELMEESGAVVKTDKNAYKLARLFSGWAGKADHFLQFGTFNPRSLELKGPGLKQILDPVSDDLDNLRRYLVLSRSAEKLSQGIDTGIDAKVTSEALKQLIELAGPEKIKTYKSVAQKLYRYQNSLMTYLESAGMMDPEVRQIFQSKNLMYVPFYRLMEDTPSIGKGGTKKMTDLWEPTQKMKGSRRPIIDPLESIVKNTYSLINLAERNMVAQALVRQARKAEGMSWLVEDVSKKMVPTTFRLKEIKRQLEKAGFPLVELTPGPKTQQLVNMGQKTTRLTKVDAETLTDKQLEAFLTVFNPEAFAPKGQNIVSVFEDGKRKFYQLHPDLYKTMHGIEDGQANILMRLLGAPTRLLRLGATSLSPEFGIRNPLRDAMTAFAQSKSGFVPGWDSFKGLFHVLRRDDLYQEWVRSGGPHAAMLSMDRTTIRQNLKDLMASRTQWVFMHPIEALRAFSEATEAMTRVGEFGRARDKGEGRREAAFRSREVSLDFARRGTHGKALNMLVAFWNASVQGTDKFVRVHIANPKKAAIRGAVFSTISILNYVANRDDEEYHDLPRWLKDWAWLIPTKGTPLEKYTRWIPIPKPFLWGIVYSTPLERTMEWIDRKDPSAFDGLAKEVFEGVNPGFIPTAVRPLIEAYANRNIFTNRPLIPQHMKNVDPTYQAHPYTSQWAKTTAQALNKAGIRVSPIILDNTLQGYTGGLGRTLTRAVDLVSDDTGPVPQMADLPFLRAFAVRYPSASTESVTKFYERMEELEQKSATQNFAFQNGIKLGPGEKLTGPEDFELKRIRQVNKRMSALRKQIRDITASKALNPQEKRRRIDNANSQIVKLARQAVKTFRRAS